MCQDGERRLSNGGKKQPFPFRACLAGRTLQKRYRGSLPGALSGTGAGAYGSGIRHAPAEGKAQRRAS